MIMLSPSSSSFTHPVTVYYEDTDAAGVVYYANYLRFCERARTEALRTLGFEQQRLMQEKAIGFVVRHVEADYLAPARLDDQLMVYTSVIKLGGASLTFLQEIVRSDDRLFSSRIIIACLDMARQRPTAIPQQLRSSFSQYLQK